MTATKSCGNIRTPSDYRENMSNLMLLDNKKIDIEFSTHSEVPQNFLPELNIYSRSARFALKTLISGHSTVDLDIHNHTHLVSDKNVLVSLSHTKKVACAAKASAKDFSGIGIDIENRSRAIKPGIEKFFINDHDEVDDKLLLWSTKEAIFKAISPFYKSEKTLVLKDITIHKDLSYSCFEFHGQSNFDYFKIGDSEYLVSVCALIN